MGTRATKLADQFEQAVSDFAKTIEACTDAEWAGICTAEGWTVAQTAQHVSGQFPLEMTFITAAAEGKPMPDLSWDQLNEKNDTRAEKNAAATKASVINELRTNAASVSAYLRALTDEQLDSKGALGLADGAMLTTEQLINSGVLIEHVTGHLQSIRTAAQPART